MFNDERFEQIGIYPPSGLVLKYPGTDIVLLYRDGTAYANLLPDRGISPFDHGTVAYAALNIAGLECRIRGEPIGPFGDVGRDFAETINNPDSDTVLHDQLTREPLYLFLSMVDGKRAISIPSLGDDDSIDEPHFDEMLVGWYAVSKHRSAEQVYVFHQQLVAGCNVSDDRRLLGSHAATLPRAANKAYELALDWMMHQ
jgi:hypothetical protein